VPKIVIYRSMWYGVYKMNEINDALCDWDTPSVESGPAITTLSSHEVYRNKWLRVREDLILRANGQTGIYGVVEKNPGAIILPIDQGRIWLVEQFRYTIGARALELPQGCWDTDDADPEELARGELREETGLVAAEMIQLGTLWLAYGYTRQPLHVFLATDLNFIGRDLDKEEQDMTVRSVSLSSFEDMMLDGTIRDGCTLSAWGFTNSGRQSRLEAPWVA
jgi:ADP-ribose pyrophosphatase